METSTVCSAQNVTISPLNVEFRVPFTMNVIDGQFMNAKQEVHLFLFQFGSTFNSFHCQLNPR